MTEYLTTAYGERFEDTSTYLERNNGAIFAIGADNGEYPFFEVYIYGGDYAGEGYISCYYDPNRLFPAHLLITKE